MTQPTDPTRRRFMVATSAAGIGLLLASCKSFGRQPAEGDTAEADVGPVEDLMREHGVLARLLLVQEEGARRLKQGQEVAPEVFVKSAGLVRRFIEDYHEKQEEEDVFPRMEKAGKLADLARVLRAQHQAGRRMTDIILQNAASKQAADREKLLDAVARFARMYRPHRAREDTELFPAFHETLTETEFDKLGDKFEDRERKIFGEGGFERIVGEVTELEKALAINDLSPFTPV